MLLNSTKYFIFLPIVYLIYCLVGARARWVVLLVASLSFYAALNVPYLLLVLALVSLTSFAFGIWIERAEIPSSKRALLWTGIVLNMLILFVMKYLSFLVSNLKSLSDLISLNVQVPPVQPLVAIGVSYYVFQATSYLFDVYLELEKPEKHFGYFALYLSFFPKLLQGPIERAGNLIPQLGALGLPNLEQFRSGLLLIIFGLFKKAVIADRLSLFVDPVYADVHTFSTVSFILATYAYAFQIYFDFSGYTDIALGSARLFGINLTQNFNSPYLATSVADFWRRWHISFSSWILNYIFTPLQMQWRILRSWSTAAALMVAFLISGLWHGASWGFIVWGGLHGLYMACSIFYKPYQKRLHKTLGVGKSARLKVWQTFVTFHLICVSWIFFRANSVSDAFYVLTHLFRGTDSSSLVREFEVLSLQGATLREFFVVAGSALLLILGSSIVKNTELHLDFYRKPFWVRCCFYYCAAMYVLTLGYFSNQSFAYVKF